MVKTAPPLLFRFGGVFCAFALLIAGPARARGALATEVSQQRISLAAGLGSAALPGGTLEGAVAYFGGRVRLKLARAEPADTRSAKLRRVPVRVGLHGDFTRIVFDWPATVPYSLTESGDKVTVTFGRSAQIDLRRLRAQLERGLANPRARILDGHLEFTIDKPSNVKVRHFFVGPKVVLDFSVAASPAHAASAEPVRGGATPGESDIAPRAAPVLPVFRTPQAKSSTGPATGGKEEIAGPLDTATAAAGRAESRVGMQADNAAPVTAILSFYVPGPSGAAVFRRDPYVWIVFDQLIEPSIEALREAAAGLVDNIEQVPMGVGTAIRLRPKSGVNPQVEQDGDRWLVRLRRWPITPQFPIPLQPKSDGREGAEVILSVSETGQVLSLPDPEVGDMLLIATARQPGQGISERRRYPQFELLPSAQGVAVKPLGDDIELQNAGTRGVIVTRAKGLHLSPITSGGAVSGGKIGPRVFDLAGWSNGPAGNYANALQAALRAITDAPEERRDEARLKLARLYFAHGMAPEALGVLRTLESARSPLAVQPEFRALKGASLAYMGRHVEARKALLDKRLDRYREIALWRALMHLHAGEIEKAAAGFRTGDAVLKIYPEPYRTKLALQGLEAGIGALDVKSASMWVERLERRSDKLARPDLAHFLYVQGLFARQRRDLDRAVLHWTDVKATGDRRYGARAEFALIELGLQQQALSSAEAIERLERLSYRWRGDELEIAVLNKLGRLYLAKGDYRRGLARMRTAAANFADKDEAKAMVAAMAGTFRSLFLDGKADTLSPLEALTLFDEFRDLTPAGPDGDAMIRKLTDRLIGAALLDRASALLSHQVRVRLTGENKAEGGAKLALIHLLDRHPKAALLALRTSHQSGLPRAIEDDRRRIRAKAMLDLGRSEEAVALLAGDASTDADLLRLDLYWHTKQYAEAATVFRRLAGEPLAAGAYGPRQAQYVLGWAAALRLTRDEAGLRKLRDLYGAGMAKSRLADSFAAIVRSPGASREDIEAISRRVVEADGFETFLRNYRERLMPSTTAVSTEKRLQEDGGSIPAGGRPAGGVIPPPPPPH